MRANWRATSASTGNGSHVDSTAESVASRGARSDCGDSDVRVVGGERFEVGGVVGKDQSTTEADGGGDDESIYGHLTTRLDCGQQVAGDPGDPDTGGDDLGVPPSKLQVDGLVGAAPR
jgi:hypothetical protein